MEKVVFLSAPQALPELIIVMAPNVIISDVLSANQALKIWVRVRGVRAPESPSTAGR